MFEEVITSGRMNHLIDPVLHVWHWQIPLYLFLGGIAAGLLFYSAYFYLAGKENEYPIAVKWMPLGAPVLIAIGLGALLLDLSHFWYFWQLFTNIRWESPMSWGAWTLGVIMPLSILWILSWIRDLMPDLDLKYDIVKQAVDLLITYRKVMAYVLIVLALVLGMYTGILLSAFNSRPFWNTSILGPLFLVSGLSASAALAAYFAKTDAERHMFTKIDIVMLLTELVFIVHLVMGFLSGTRVHVEAVQLILGQSSYTITFWGGIVLMGLIIPIFLETMELGKRKVPVLVPTLLVIFGNILLRFLFVEVGQISQWIY